MSEILQKRKSVFAHQKCNPYRGEYAYQISSHNLNSQDSDHGDFLGKARITDPINPEIIPEASNFPSPILARSLVRTFWISAQTSIWF
jgi:hypothetical protein